MMSKTKLIGNYLVHDSVIEEINLSKKVLVKLKAQNNSKIRIEFINIKSIKIQNVIGMMLYSITQEEDIDYNCKKYNCKKYIFMNWDEDGDGYMEIIAEEYVYEII